jgi:hypothetical protein
VQIAFATCASHPGIDSDDEPLARALAAHGIEVVPRVWDAPNVEWGRFAAVLIRNTWDYHRHRPRYLAWAERVDSVSTLLNPLAALRWNTHKRYLRDLELRGIRIVPTAWIDARLTCDLGALLTERGWDEGQCVVKPAVSLGGEDTMRFDRTSLRPAQALLESITQREAALVQPYFPSVETYGERSLIFFEGHFSHAIRKCPALGGDPADKPLPAGPEQRRAPGPERAVDPTDAELAFAAQVLHAASSFAPPPVYARVDLAFAPATAPSESGPRSKRDGEPPHGRPHLMELEMVEPSLFFRHDANAAARLAGALAGRIGSPARVAPRLTPAAAPRRS